MNEKHKSCFCWFSGSAQHEARATTCSQSMRNSEALTVAVGVDPYPFHPEAAPPLRRSDTPATTRSATPRRNP